MHTPLLQLQDLHKSFLATPVLTGISLELQPGDFLAITGPSGSGKTTLLGILGLLEPPSSGSYLLKGRCISDLNDMERSRLRNQTFGFVFQQFSLIPDLEVWQNVARPLHYAGVSRREQKERALALLERLGLTERAAYRPAQLSGGEQQGVAIARALVNDPEIILADEPTGNLPKAQWEPVLEVLEMLYSQGKTIILVTHNPEVAARATWQHELRSGSLSERRSPQGGAEAGATLKLNFLGRIEASYHGKPLLITTRQAEILTVLARYPEGLSGEALLLRLYGEKGKPSTLKAALSKLRKQVSLASQPYRLEESVAADFLQFEALLKEGRLQEAVSCYRGPLLPSSTTPDIVTWREQLEEALRQSVLASGDPEASYALAERFEDDLELWEAAAKGLSGARQMLASANVARIKQAWGEASHE